jgi:hypothetical protein
MNVKQQIEKFIGIIKKTDVELYNEAGLQHELGFYLRSKLGDNWLIQLERNIDAIVGNKKSFIKAEMDIYLKDRGSGDKYCIELKAPNSFQIPNRMFMSFQDVQFLEQLKEAGFKETYFLFVSPNQSYWQSKTAQGNIYRYFNGKEVEFKALYKTDVLILSRKKCVKTLLCR